MGWHGKCTALLLLALSLTMATAASKMNTGYLLPGHEFKVAPSASGDISRFCALTFDDGPDSKYTPKVMKILRDEGVSATFFVIGRQVRGYPEQVRQMVADGHEVANHSWSHADFTKLSAKAQRAELDKCSAALAELDISPRWFRPPYGAFNKSTTRQAQEAGLIPLLWSVDPRDWAEPGAGVIISRVSSQVTNGGVVLLHSTHGQTVEALPGLIRKLRDKGYSFVTLSQWQALVTGQQLPVPVSPGLPEQLENYSPDTTQPGDSLPGIADGATPEDLQIPELPGQGTPLIRVEPFTLKPRPGENAGGDSPAADSMASADGEQQPASGPYEITEEDALAPRESREWQFATPPTLQDLIDGLPDAEEFVPAGSAVPEDSLGRANALRLRALAGRVLALRMAAEAPADGVLDVKAPEPLHIHSNFRSAEELERWLR